MSTPNWSPQQDAALQAVAAWHKDKRSPQVFRLFGYAGTGKAQPVDTPIPTPNGWRRIGDLQVGDSVFGSNGAVTQVTGVFPQGTRSVYRVTFRDGSSTRCCGEHLWRVMDLHRRWRTLDTAKMQALGARHKSGPYRYQIPLCEPVQYRDAVLPLDPYVLGVLIGDGYLCGSIAAISTPDQDADIIDRVAPLLPAGHYLRKDTSPACPRYTIKKPASARRNAVMTALRELGLNVHSRDKAIPQPYLQASPAQRLDLLRGLMDTDGCCVQNRTSFSTTSRSLVAGLTELVASLGGTAIETSSGRAAEFHVNVKMTVCPFNAARKAARWKPSKKNPPSRYITDVAVEGEAECVCIRVSAEDSLYVTENYIVTHNTTLAVHLAKSFKRVLFAAFTGKAALVMRRKGCTDASTIHSLIYMPKEGPSTSDEPQFSLNELSEVKDADLVVIDECSMVNEELAKDLLWFRTKVLVLGDPAQLPPVKGTGYFTEVKPDFMLTEIHRQAQDNPIIRLSMDVREGRGLTLGDHGAARVIRRADFDERDLILADQVLVGRNRTREQYNRRYRELAGFAAKSPVFPMKGEKLICLRNERSKGLLNGSMWNVASCKVAEKWVKLVITSDASRRPKEKEVQVLPQFFDGREMDMPWEVRRGSSEMIYGYAITVHKSQGSQFDNVLLMDESAAFREDARRWLYTGVTRAAERITIVVD